MLPSEPWLKRIILKGTFCGTVVTFLVELSLILIFRSYLVARALAIVNEIAWALFRFPDGYSLLACSLDGTIAYIHCGRLVTGSVITKEQQVTCIFELLRVGRLYSLLRLTVPSLG